MKRLVLSMMMVSMVFFGALGQGVNLEVGVKAPSWNLTDADGKEFTMDVWAGKVLQVNYVDPDESDMNEPLNDAIKKAKDVDKRIDSGRFKGFGIVDTKSTWKPNALIRSIAGNKAKKFDTTILFDYKGALQTLWGLPKDNYTVIILDKNRVCRAIYKGKVADSEQEKIIALIIKLTNE